jgi:predicted hotdog family 3-hydroxylacyl-ACP dehydratase
MMLLEEVIDVTDSSTHCRVSVTHDSVLAPLLMRRVICQAGSHWN